MFTASIHYSRFIFFSVHIEIASICSYLPSSEDNGAPFTGNTVAPNIRPDFAAKGAKRNADTQAQLEDAERRRVVWDAEPFGETVDPKIERQRGATRRAPLGVRRGDNIEPIPGIVRHTGGKHVVPGLNDVVGSCRSMFVSMKAEDVS